MRIHSLTCQNSVCSVLNYFCFHSDIRTNTMGSLATAKDEHLERKQDLNSIWPELLSEICASADFQDMPTANIWLETLMSKTVPNGKKTRALLTITFYDQLVKNPSEADRKRCLIAAWCNEITQAAALIADDIMDESETRRGEICWYKQSDVGLSAVNDCLMLENITYFILYKYFSLCDYFPRLLKHCHEMVMITIMGQCLDTRSSLPLDFNECTLDKYKQIVKYKTSYYTFYHPIAIAMIMARITDQKLYIRVMEVALEIGYLFQAQDDFLDCFGNIKLTGKVGTDISDGKCTWLLVKALELASDSQRKTLEDNYGQKGKIEEKTITGIYFDLDIEEHFFTFETQTYRHICELIEELPKFFPREPLYNILKLIYRRKK